MKKIPEKYEILAAIIMFLGFTLIGINLKSTIIGACLFAPFTFVRMFNFTIENTDNYFKMDIKKQANLIIHFLRSEFSKN